MEETKIDGQLVLLPGTIKFLPHRLDVVNRCTVQCIRNHMLASYCLEDNNKFPSLSRKNMTGWPQKYNQQLNHPEQLPPHPKWLSTQVRSLGSMTIFTIRFMSMQNVFMCSGGLSSDSSWLRVRGPHASQDQTQGSFREGNVSFSCGSSKVWRKSSEYIWWKYRYMTLHSADPGA
jgi:hypothetical protein